MNILSVTSRLPTLFVSHGAPTLAIEDSPAHRFLSNYGKTLGKPEAILMLSAHFDSQSVTVTAGNTPGTIHDFGGFPKALYDIRYPAPGNPVLANQVTELLQAGGVRAHADPARGLDHGAWVPLMLMYPDADVPVVQLSIDSRMGPMYHFRLGELLRPLREEGVLIIGSGGATHNLRQVLQHMPGEVTPEWVIAFREWLAESVESDRRDELAQYRARGPYAPQNHPTEEHFMPLLGAMGATTPGEPAKRIHVSETHGVLAMDAFLFGLPTRTF